MTETTPEPASKPRVSFEDFARLDLRVATIVAAEPHPAADRLLKLRLDDGTAEGRQICAGIKGHYEPDQLVGRQIVIVANLEPRKIRGEESNGMLLAASDAPKGEDDRRVILLAPSAAIAPGSVVS